MVNEKDYNVLLMDEGVWYVEKFVGVESFYIVGNMEWLYFIDNVFKVYFLYKCDVNYVVKEGCVVIVDEFIGCFMEGCQWSDGFYQVVEVKENVKIKDEI